MNFTPFSFYVQKLAPAIPNTPVTTNLILNLDVANTGSYTSGGSTWTDTVGGKVFTLYGSPTYNASNYSLEFLTSGTQYARWAQTVTTSNFAIFNGFTMEAWVKWPASSQYFTTFNAWDQFFSLGGASSNQKLASYIKDSSTVYYQVPNGSYNNSINTWHQITLTWNQSTGILQMYSDRNTFGPATTGATSLNSNTGAGSGLGIFRTAFNSDTGYIGIIRVYSRALSAAEIEQNYHANKTRFGLT